MKAKLVETMRRVRDLEVARASSARAEAEAAREAAERAVLDARNALDAFDQRWSEMTAAGVSPHQLRLADAERARHVEALAQARAGLREAAERVSRAQAEVARAQQSSRNHEKLEERLEQLERKRARRAEQKTLDDVRSSSPFDD
jgi:flagellar biosynthesis chaperone FliJ